MSENVIQPSFSSGELSPNLFARVDISKYHSGAATMRNFFVDYRSGASTRAGTEFVMPCQNDAVTRLVRFQQSVDVTYVLVFGNSTLRFISNGGAVVESHNTITGITNAVGPTISVVHSYNIGDLVFITGTNTQADDRFFTVFNVVPGVSFQIIDPWNASVIDSSQWTPWVSGGAVQRVYTINTPWADHQLRFLKFSQRASTMNITHFDTPPYVLTLLSATNWTLSHAIFGSTAVPPTNVTAAASAAGPANYKYTVTGVDANNQESQQGNIAHADGVVDMRTTAGSIGITWLGGAGSVFYNIYGATPSLLGTVPDGTQFGFIGTVDHPTGDFVDTNIGPDFTSTPPIANNPFVPPDNHPQVSAYFQQRLVYANAGGNDPDRFWMSKTGSYYNFDISNPSQPNDSIDARLVSLEVNEIKSMVPMPTGLIMLTTRGAWLISGGAGGVASQGGPITPLSITATSQAYIGANDVPPILINYDIFFIQQKGSIVRDLTYSIYSNIYTGNDISIMSSHLFYGHQIVEWAYAEEPFKTIWAVREDGTLLSLTVVKEQEMYGWARHDTLGNFKSVCTVTEGLTDAAYFVVDRFQLDGTIRKMVERMAERTFDFGAEDAWSVDCGLTSEHNTPDSTLLISLPGANVVGGTAHFTSIDAHLTGSEVGWVVRAAGGKAIVTSIAVGGIEFTGTITQAFTQTIPDDPLNRPNVVFAGDWAIDQPFSQVTGLDHLESQRVSVLTDGGVVNGLTVVNGAITLPQPVTKATVGLGFQAQLQTMYLDLGQESNTVQGKRKKIGALTVRVKDSRGLKAGRTFAHLVPIKELNRITLMGQSTPLITADERIVMDPLWDVPGQICLQVDDPLPATVLGVIPEVVIGDTPK
jgi:hypothetical protein